MSSCLSRTWSGIIWVHIWVHVEKTDKTDQLSCGGLPQTETALWSFILRSVPQPGRMDLPCFHAPSFPAHPVNSGSSSSGSAAVLAGGLTDPSFTMAQDKRRESWMAWCDHSSHRKASDTRAHTHVQLLLRSWLQAWASLSDNLGDAGLNRRTTVAPPTGDWRHYRRVRVQREREGVCVCMCLLLQGSYVVVAPVLLLLLSLALITPQTLQMKETHTSSS